MKSRWRITYEYPGGITTGVFGRWLTRFIIKHHRIGSIRIKRIRKSKERYHFASVKFT